MATRNYDPCCVEFLKDGEMEILVETMALTDIDCDWLIVPVWEDGEFDAGVAAVDDALGKQLTRLKEAGDLSGKLAETLLIPDASGIAAGRVLLVGLGKRDVLTISRFHKAYMTAARKASEKKDVRVATTLPETLPDAVSRDAACQSAAVALTVGCVGQGVYQAESSRHLFAAATLAVSAADDSAAAETAVQSGAIIGEAMNLARDLINRMADEIYPASFAERAEEVAGEIGIECTVLDEHQIKEERMGSLMGVAIGSDRPPRFVVLKYAGGGAGDPTLALVGKGVTFDSGGLSLKPTDSMSTMKSDMSGAATVLAAISAIARLKLPVNVTGYMGLVENMISGSSYKLGDVLTARNGVTIEVLNTDAEGRLVLADVLSYAVDQEVDQLIDLATLTGSCVVALGEDIAGLFTNDQALCDEVIAAAKSCGEDVWQMPMDEEFSELLKSDVADCKNVGPRWGGAITAAKFLEKFVGGKPWVHIDIAGPAFASSNKSYREGGATGCLVRTLVEHARQMAAG